MSDVSFDRAQESYDRLAAMGPPEPVAADDCPDCGGAWDGPNDECSDCGVTGGAIANLPLRYEITYVRDDQLVEMDWSRHRTLRAAQLVAAQHHRRTSDRPEGRRWTWLVRDRDDPERGDLAADAPREDDA